MARPYVLGVAERPYRRAVGERTGQTFSVADSSLDELLARAAKETQTTLTILLDQFEEYFLYHPESEAENRFDAEFARAVNRDDVDANFLLAMREDSLALLNRFQKRIPNLFDNYLRIERLSRAAARAAIEKPLEKYNEVYGTQIDIEPALVDEVLDRVRPGRVVLGEGGQGVLAAEVAPDSSREERVETPYLQLVMTRLWDEEKSAGSPVLRLTTFRDLGGAEHIAETHLDNTLNTLSADEQDIVGSIFRHLVTPGGAKIALGLDDLAGYAEVGRTQLKPVLDKLADQTRRILRPVAPQSDRPAESRDEFSTTCWQLPSCAGAGKRAKRSCPAGRRGCRKAGKGSRPPTDSRAPTGAGYRSGRSARHCNGGGHKRQLLPMIWAAADQRAAQKQQHHPEGRSRGCQGRALNQRDVATQAQATADAAQKDALIQRDIATSRQLAAQGVAGLERDPQLGLLLGVEALTVTQSVEADKHGAPALQEARTRMILRGHSDNVTAMAFSPNGRWLATAGADKTARVWRMKHRRPGHPTNRGERCWPWPSIQRETC